MDGTASTGILQLYRAPNPSGAVDQLYLLQGDAASRPVEKIISAPGEGFPPAPAFPGPRIFHLQIIHFNDFHGHLVHFGRDQDQSLISRVAGHLFSLRQQCEGDPSCAVLALSAGDDCGGSVFDELLERQQSRVSHLYYQLYSALGLDAACPGNHDFDRGLDFLESAVQAEARFPMLAANVISTDDFTRGIYPAAVLVVKGIRVGLIGLVTRAENRLSEEEGQIVDPRPVARRLVELLHPMCDVLIILSHLGRAMADHAVPMADCGDAELAASLQEGSVDLIIGGHSHHALNQHGLDPENVVNGIPILQAGADGTFVGQVSLAVRPGSTKVQHVQLIPVDTLPVDRVFEEHELAPWKRAAYELLSREMGVVAYEDPEQGSPQADFAAGEMALANFLTDALHARMAAHDEPVDFVILDASALHGSVSQGAPLTYADCFEMMPYHDTIRIYRLTGAELIALLEDNCLRLRVPGEVETLECGFLQFSAAVRYRARAGSSRAQSRLLEAAVSGEPLREQLDRVFTAAATCFTRELCSVWESAASPDLRARLLSLHKLPHRDTDRVLRDEITAYIAEHGGITAASGARKDGRLEILLPE